MFVEQREGIIQKVALELLGKARELADSLNEKVIALLLGYDMKDQAQELIAYGADIVVCVDERELAEYNTEPYAQAVSQFIRERHPAIVLIGATTIGRDLGPRLSARLTTGLTADCTGLDISPENDLLMTRPAFGGNLMATIICKEHRPQMSTVRPGVMRTKPKDPARRGTIENMKVSFDPSKFRVKILKTVKEQKTRIDITEAKVLVSGGRGVGSTAGFVMLGRLAEKLNAEVCTSPTNAKWGKPERRSGRICILPWGFQGLFSTLPVWKNQNTSLLSIKTNMLRSSMQQIWGLLEMYIKLSPY